MARKGAGDRDILISVNNSFGLRKNSSQKSWTRLLKPRILESLAKLSNILD